VSFPPVALSRCPVDDDDIFGYLARYLRRLRHSGICGGYANRCVGNIPGDIFCRSGLLFNRSRDGSNNRAYFLDNLADLPDLAGFCSIHADSMNVDSGASRYYSPANPVAAAGLNQFIPDARGYPFTETEYTPDNTGRINRLSGLGYGYQLGSGHEIAAELLHAAGTPNAVFEVRLDDLLAAMPDADVRDV